MCRQGTLVASGGAGTVLLLVSRRGGFLRRLTRADRLFDILQRQLQLIRRQLLRTAAELLAQQALDQQAKLVILRLQLGMGLRGGVRRANHVPQHLPQDRRIIGQGGEIDLHAAIITIPTVPAPMTPA
jgi:hypothetical protein